MAAGRKLAQAASLAGLVSEPLELSYVLPLRWNDGSLRGELTEYLRRIATDCSQIIVVDGSPPGIYDANAAAWGAWVAHVPPDAEASCKMGKVAGVTTGVRRAAHELVVIADDDVRYERSALERVALHLGEYDLVRPQNYFEPLPWHARWDTARTLLNRALGADFPGTLGVRRSRFVAMGGYDGDVMFENLELIRSVEASGGRVFSPLDLYVRRLPPTTSHFWGQRTRQAYDDFAIPARMICWLALLPLLTAALLHRRATLAAPGAAAVTVLAERGRRRCDGRTVFPASASLLAPAWVLERGLCSWLAVLQRLRFGGVRYGDNVIRTAAHTKAQIARVQSRRDALPSHSETRARAGRAG
jgi:hypothetical protein